MRGVRPSLLATFGSRPKFQEHLDSLEILFLGPLIGHTFHLSLVVFALCVLLTWVLLELKRECGNVPSTPVIVDERWYTRER